MATMSSEHLNLGNFLGSGSDFSMARICRRVPFRAVSSPASLSGSGDVAPDHKGCYPQECFIMEGWIYHSTAVRLRVAVTTMNSLATNGSSGLRKALVCSAASLFQYIFEKLPDTYNLSVLSIRFGFIRLTKRKTLITIIANC